MSRKPADLSGIIAKKGEAKSETAYPGDDKPTAAKSVKTRVQTAAKTNAKAGVPSKFVYEKSERRSDALNVRITPSERERIEAICERTGAPITQVLIWGLEALERELGE